MWGDAMARFYVDDGFFLYRTAAGHWVDDVDESARDLLFYAGPDGAPIDCDGAPLAGHIVDE